MDCLPVLVRRRLRLSKRWCAVVLCFLLFIYKMCWIYIQPHENRIPARKFAFMKNHKCGTSTVENIIFRYAQKNDLNIVLPKRGNYLSKSGLFDHHSIRNTIWKNVAFDIFSFHCRWNREEVMVLLGGQVPTFTIVRDPVDVFVSFFYYLDELRDFYQVQDIHQMVEKIKKQPALPVLRKRWHNSVGRNQMAWDMGLSPDIFDDKVAMKREIERLDREFDLVMVTHRMDESLILLMDLLDWSLQDIVHLDLNRRKPDKLSPLGRSERDVLVHTTCFYKHPC